MKNQIITKTSTENSAKIHGNQTLTVSYILLKQDAANISDKDSNLPPSKPCHGARKHSKQL